ncbi:MAG: DUF1847 domain-containing protein [Clostridiales bacterium]|nr:DUF1847 domain-containing protein [Clostridiales bacterium]
MENKKIKRSCIDCAVINCDHEDKMYPDFCPTTELLDAEKSCKDGCMSGIMQLYIDDAENFEVTRASAEVEYENYCRMTRLEEIAEFAKKMGAKKLGIATCVGLIAEAGAAAKYYRYKGFEVYGIGCKAGAVSKSFVGLEDKLEEVGKNMCNPILQAKLLNREETDLNIVIGLCVGHDSLFYKYSDALCTTLVTKDRVLGHNPVAALYQLNTYYSKLMK